MRLAFSSLIKKSKPLKETNKKSSIDPAIPTSKAKPKTLLFFSLSWEYSLTMMLFTPNPNIGDKIIAKDKISFISPQSSKELEKARGSTMIVLMAPAIVPMTMLMVFEYACLLTKPK